MCDGPCQRAYHQECLDPKVKTKDIPKGEEDWWCHQCDALLDCMDMISERLDIKLKLSNDKNDVNYDTIRRLLFKEVSVTRGVHIPSSFSSSSTPSVSPQDMINIDVRRRVRQNPLRMDIQGTIRSFDQKINKYLVVFHDGIEQEMTIDEIEISLCRSDSIGTDLVSSSSSGGSGSGGTILDMMFDDDDDEDFDEKEVALLKKEMISNSEGSSDSEDDASESSDSSDSNMDSDAEDDEEDDEDEDEDGKVGMEDEEEEDDGTRWGWLPHSGSAESGWMDENSFQNHYGEKDWEEKWKNAEQHRIPKKIKFKEYYGTRTWKRHWQWHQEDDDATLVSRRDVRQRNVVNYEVLLTALQVEDMDYGDSVDEKNWNEDAQEGSGEGDSYEEEDDDEEENEKNGQEEDEDDDEDWTE